MKKPLSAPRKSATLKTGARVSPAASKAKATALSAAASSASGNSLVRLLALLDLFTPAAPAWTFDALTEALGMSRSTGYRYVKALCDAGLLAPVSNGYYILGPRFIEIDRQIRQCDPLYISGGPVMKELVERTGHSSLLCALYKGSVLCVRDELTPDSPPNLFMRGQRRPLFQGAASKIMLAYLQPHQLRSLFAKYGRDITAAGLGADWDAFRDALGAIRRDGVVMTAGEFNAGVVGISAPVFNSEKRILGSVGISGAAEKFDRARLEQCFVAVREAAQQISERVEVMSFGMDRPARGVL